MIPVIESIDLFLLWARLPDKLICGNCLAQNVHSYCFAQVTYCISSQLKMHSWVLLYTAGHMIKTCIWYTITSFALCTVHYVLYLYFNMKWSSRHNSWVYLCPYNCISFRPSKYHNQTVQQILYTLWDILNFIWLKTFCKWWYMKK